MDRKYILNFLKFIPLTLLLSALTFIVFIPSTQAAAINNQSNVLNLAYHDDGSSYHHRVGWRHRHHHHHRCYTRCWRNWYGHLKCREFCKWR